MKILLPRQQYDAIMAPPPIDTAALWTRHARRAKVLLAARIISHARYQEAIKAATRGLAKGVRYSPSIRRRCNPKVDRKQFLDE